MPSSPAAGGTVYRKFTTRATTGVPTTLSGTPVVSIYKDASTTQSTAGVTLTVDFDAVTGLNHISVDTSADGTFYVNGSTYYAVITTGTVGGVSVVGEVVGDFELALACATSADVTSLSTQIGSPVQETDLPTNFSLLAIDGQGDVTFNNSTLATVATVTNPVTVTAAAPTQRTWGFVMRLLNGDLAPGVTVSTTRSTDGGGQVATDNQPVEVGSGEYKLVLTVNDQTFTDEVIFYASATGCQVTFWKYARE